MPPPPRPPSPLAARIARVEPAEVREVLEECAAGMSSPPISLARLLLAVQDTGEVAALLASVLRGETGSPLAEAARLLRDHPEGCEAAAAILHDHPDLHGPPLPFRQAIARNRRFFDRAVAVDETASVAAYSFGDAALLDAFTREIVDVLERWSILGSERSALEIGCGIGRLLPPLAARLREIHGLDISPRMVAAARRRCAGLANVQIRRGSGYDLAGFADGSLDAVLAVDSFPYIHLGGAELVLFYFAEIERVLRPGGDFALFNYSYRASRQADLLEVRRLARSFGFKVLAAGGHPFRLWDAEAYHLRRS